MYSVTLTTTLFPRAHSLESLVEGHNWFSNQFVEIPRRSIIVLSASYLFWQKPVYTFHHLRRNCYPSPLCFLTTNFIPKFLRLSQPNHLLADDLNWLNWRPKRWSQFTVYLPYQMYCRSEYSPWQRRVKKEARRNHILEIIVTFDFFCR